jgi:cytosine/adenosine deaminase-related metal-dependent hydrolase
VTDVSNNRYEATVAGAAPRGEYLIRGAHVVSVDPAIGDLPVGDIHVRDGVILAVALRIDAPGAEVIDAVGCIALPGFVEVHWHMWNSIWRGLAHDGAQYFALHQLAPSYTARDHYDAVRYAALEAVNVGITTCHNWAHAVRDFDDAEAEMQALVDSGIRARFGYGDSWPLVQEPLGVSELRRALDWIDDNGDGRLSLGIAIHNPVALADEIDAARQLDLATIATHVDYSRQIHLLGPDVLFTHGAGASPELIALIAKTRMKVGLCPSTDPLIGAGLPPLQELIEGGVQFKDLGFSVDVTCQTPADPFSAMRTLLNSARMHQRRGGSFEKVLAEDLFGSGPPTPLMRPRQVIELATLNGAHVLGLDHVTGSLTPGKRADLILVRTDQPNMLPVPDTNPTFQLVQCGQPANVDTVLIDGRILKRSGELLHVDGRDVVVRAAAAQSAIRDRAGLAPIDLLQ